MTEQAISVTSSDKSLSEWLRYLESIHPSTIDMGLTRVRQVADAMGLTLKSSTLITVAGTNGKGTTCRLMEALLLAQGKTVGVYASPHLLDYRERVRMNGAHLSERAFCDAFEAVEQARGETTLTYFEFGTLAAISLFMQHQPDVVLLEVGLGGRLDATNILDPDLAVITTIDLDHQDWLGDTREAIAKEKAGIMRENGVAVIGELMPPTSLEDEVTRLHVDASWASRDFTLTPRGAQWDWQCGDLHVQDLPLPQIPLQNAATVLACLHRLGWLEDNDELRQTIAQTVMPGRRQRLASQPDVIVDVAHNPQATRALRDWLDTQSEAPLHIVVGMLRDKDVTASLAPLTDLNATWYVASTAGPRGMPAQTLVETLNAAGRDATATFDTVTDAYHSALTHSAGTDRILVFGSFLTVADVLALHIDKSGIVK